MDLSLEIRTAQNVTLAIEPAGAGQRILATLIDMVIAGAYLWAMGTLLSKMSVRSETAFILIMGVPLLLYHLVMEVVFEGRSVGKMVLRTRVARLDGAQPTLGQYGLRWLLRLLDVSFTSGVVALISVVLTKRSQRLGDIVAGTTVVRQRRRLELTHVLYPLIPEGYEPTFPEAERLSDSEIRTVRSVIARLQISSRSQRSIKLADRAKRAVERRLDLGDVRMPSEAFLRTIVRDHVARLDRVIASGDRMATPRGERPSPEVAAAPRG